LRRITLASALALSLALCGGLLSGAAAGAQPAPALVAPTPYMGWDTYFAIANGFNESSILQQAALLKSSGLEADGYRLIWLDAGWWQGQRDAQGNIAPSATQWPHGIAWLASTLHANGFKLGVYTDGGPTGCGSPAGSFGHYQQDINTLASWGVDALKVDWCGGSAKSLDPATQYTQIHEAIVNNSSHRPMILNVCNFLQPGQKSAPTTPPFTQSAFDSYSFGETIATSWRTDTDVGAPGNVPFSAVLRNMDADATSPLAAGPGHWNDPDYLGPDQGMTAAQFQTQFSMWAMLAAPLMISDNMTAMSKASLATVSNRAVIAVDQDPAGIQGTLVSWSGNGEVWSKPLINDSYAVALLNRGSAAMNISTSASALGLPAAHSYTVTNLWTSRRSSSSGSFSSQVQGDSTVMLRVSPATSAS
jgi:alpha-galactosidase